MTWLVSHRDIQAMSANRRDFENFSVVTDRLRTSRRAMMIDIPNVGVLMHRQQFQALAEHMGFSVRALPQEPLTPEVAQYISVRQPRLNQAEIERVTVAPVEGGFEQFVPLRDTHQVLERLRASHGIEMAFVADLPEERDPDTLYVKFLSSIAPTRNASARAGSWSGLGQGISLPAHTRLRPSGQGATVSIGNGPEVAEYLPRSGVIHLLVAPALSAGIDKLVAHVLQQAAVLAAGPGSPVRQARLRDAARQRLVRQLLQHEQNVLSHAQNAIANNARQIERFAQELPRQVAAQEAAFKVWHETRTGNNNRDEISREYDRIAAIDKVDRLNFESRRMIIYTKPIICTQPNNGDTYLIGRCKITLNMADRHDMMMTVQNLDRRVGSHDHPHVQSQRPCMGNMGQILGPLLHQGHLSAAVGAAIAYLETCNPEDAWGSTITSWPLIARGNRAERQRRG